MARREKKAALLSILDNPQWAQVQQILVREDRTTVIHVLFTGLCSVSFWRRWNAVRAFGYFVPLLAQEDLEGARILIRRLFWSLNDESGGIGWGAPEALAECLVASEPLFHEYQLLFLSFLDREEGSIAHAGGNFLEHPVLQQGVLWGVARLAASYPEEMRSLACAERLQSFLQGQNETILLLALFGIAQLFGSDTPSYFRSLAQSKLACLGQASHPVLWQGEKLLVNRDTLIRYF